MALRDVSGATNINVTEWYRPLLRVMAGKPGLEPNSRVEIPAGLTGKGVHALVREVYVDMRERLLSEPGGLLACVYGTPGVGKSIFASLFVLSLAERAPECIFYRAFSSPADVTTFCIRGAQVFRISDEALGDALHLADQGDKPSWYVVDGTGGSSYRPYKSLRVVVVSSSNLEKNKWLHEVDKGATLKLLMPPFTFEELQQLSGAADTSLLRARFAEFGGSARLVFGLLRHEGWARSQVRLLGADLLRSVMDDVAEGSKTERSGSRILHQIPSAKLSAGDPSRLSYDERVVAYASPMVSDEVVRCYWEQSKSQVLRKLQQADAFSDSFVVSLVFEPVMHYRLCHGLPFSSPSGTFRLGQLRLTVLTELYGAARLCPDDTYLQPSAANYAAVDAVAKSGGKLYLFQFTGQAGGRQPTRCACGVS